MEKITLGQFLSFTNIYVPIYIEDEFNRYKGRGGVTVQSLYETLTDEEKTCPIDYIRNNDGAARHGDEKKKKDCIILGIGIENYEKYFGKE